MDALIEKANQWLRAGTAALQDKINHALAGVLLAYVPAVLWPEHTMTVWLLVSFAGVLFELGQKRWHLGECSLADALAVSFGAVLIASPVYLSIV